MQRLPLLLLLFLPRMAIAQETHETDSIGDDAAMFDSLSTVVISGERPIARMERGKLVFDMGRLQEELPAENAYELIGHIPGVAEQEGSYSVAGQQVTLIINGKQTTLDAGQVKELLQAMPAERLKNAELMMAAPARYNVRGAVINLVTEDRNKEQLAGQLQGTWYQDKYARGMGKASLTYTHGGLSLDAMYSHTNGKGFGRVEYDATQPLTTGPEEYNDIIDGRYRTIAHNYYVGADYAFKPDNKLSLAYTGKWSESRQHNTSSQGKDLAINSKTHNYLNNIDAQYAAPFGLTLGASALVYKYPQEQMLDGSLDNEDRSRNALSQQNITKWLFTANQTHRLPHSWELNYGAKAQLTHQDSWQSTETPDGEPIEQGDDEVDYTERIFSGNVSLAKSWGEKVSLEAGVEVEHYHTPVIEDTYVYPTLNLMYAPKTGHSLDLSLSSNSEYPDYWSMMNTVYYSSVYTEIWGNPDLTPERSYNVNLTYRLHQKYIFSVFADFSENTFKQLPYQPDDRMAVVMQTVNWDYRRIYGAQATAQFRIGKYIAGNAWVTLAMYHDKDEHFHDIPFDRHSLSVMFGGNISYTFWPRQRMMLILSPFFQSRSIQGVYDIEPVFLLTPVLRWSSTNGRWSASAAYNNVPNLAIRTNDTWEGQCFKMKVNQQWRTFILAVTYRFGKGKEKQQREVDTSRLGH